MQMKHEPSVIMLEFNELSPVLMNRFISQKKLPNFERLRNEAEVFTTDAGENPPNLDPWFQIRGVFPGVGGEYLRFIPQPFEIRQLLLRNEAVHENRRQLIEFQHNDGRFVFHLHSPLVRSPCPIPLNRFG